MCVCVCVCTYEVRGERENTEVQLYSLIPLFTQAESSALSIECLHVASRGSLIPHENQDFT